MFAPNAARNGHIRPARSRALPSLTSLAAALGRSNGASIALYLWEFDVKWGSSRLTVARGSVFWAQRPFVLLQSCVLCPHLFRCSSLGVHVRAIVAASFVVQMC